MPPCLDIAVTAERSPETALSQDEALLLAILRKLQPISAEGLVVALRKNPACGASGEGARSHRQIDALIVRELAEQAILREAGKRPMLVCSPKGRGALRDWALAIRHADILPADPVQTKLLAFDLLSFSEQADWLDKAETIAETQLDGLRAASEDYSPYGALSSTAEARDSLEARLNWLRALKFDLVRNRERTG